jgi:hypothetical protein
MLIFLGSCGSDHWVLLIQREWFIKKQTKKYILLVIFQTLAAANMKMIVFWSVAPCSLIDVYRRFRGASCPHAVSLIIEAATTSEKSVYFTRLHGATIQKKNISIHFSEWWTWMIQRRRDVDEWLGFLRRFREFPALNLSPETGYLNWSVS